MILEPKGRGWRLVSEDLPWEWLAAEEPDYVAARNDKRWTILRKKVQANARIGR